MDLPYSIAAVGAQLARSDPIVADPQLLTGADVFAAERERLLLRPWVAVEHHARIEEPGRYVRVEAATRSILLIRDAQGRLRALRNVCIHAGYPVCEAEEGSAERLICPYHGWEFAADGRLLEPDLSNRIDPARLRLAHHPVTIRGGLIFVDPSNATPDETDGPPFAPDLTPPWLAQAKVTDRQRYATDWNWKPALQFIRSSPHLFSNADENADFIAFGPLSLMLAQRDRATLLRVIPKWATRTEIHVVRMAPPDAPPENGSDRFAQGLLEAGDAEAVATTAPLDRAFFAWYWSLMSAD